MIRARVIARCLSWVIAMVMAGAIPAGTAWAAEPVDLELVIATDVSYSIDAEEARLQREGIIAAFRSPEVIGAIRGGALGRIAVAYIDFSSRPFNKVVIDWQIIEDQTSAYDFADKLAKAPANRGQSTSISDALELAASLIEDNALEGARRVIDVSGDGPNNAGKRVDAVRDAVLAKRITINGLPIINLADQWNSRYFLADLDRYFEGCVTGGAGSFVIVAADFVDFARAIRQKLILEIAGLAPPQPAPRPSIQRASATAIARISDTTRPRVSDMTILAQAGPTGPIYHQGCDIGERLRGSGGYFPGYHP